MGLDRILTLGNPALYETAKEVSYSDLPKLTKDIDTMFELIAEFRNIYGRGRGIAAQQIGVGNRLVCLDINAKKYVMYNPVLHNCSEEMIELWDDCMSFPNLFVKLKRHRTCTLTFKDENWIEQQWELVDDLSELLQHEIDHLDGILATQRAIDSRSFKITVPR